jgi:kynurenine 3-monooxygenase
MRKTIRPEGRVAIFGAGLVGSLLGIGLAKRGFHVEIHEKRPDLRYKSFANLRSINLALSHRGWKALEAIGLEEALRDLAIPMRGRVVHTSESASAFYPYGDGLQAISSISRHRLNCFLLDEAEKQPNLKIYFESKAEKFAFDKSLSYVGDVEGLRHRIEADAFIGADGAFSAMRYELMREDQFFYQQHYIEHGYKEFTIPPSPEGSWAMRPDGLHIWPRKSFMMIALPNEDHTFTATLFFPFHGQKSFDSIQSTEAVQKLFETEFPDLIPMMPDYQHQYRRHPVASLVTIRCAPWNKGNFLLIGDAAHAIVPFYGQGMNAGFEDCRLLLGMLDQFSHWDDLFEAFFTSRQPDAEAISELALENFAEMRDLVVDPDFQMRKKLETKLLEQGISGWVPLYTMVTFSDTPYSLAKEKGQHQARVLEQIRLREDWAQLPENEWGPRLKAHYEQISKSETTEEKASI